MRIRLIASMTALLLAAPVSLWAVPVGYDIGPYSNSEYSASWLHSAGGCTGSSDMDLDNSGSNDTLYMCPGSGGTKTALTGMLFGDWDGTILSGITGMLNGYDVTGGSLGGDYYTNNMDPLWYLDVSGKGRFYFEKINSMINQITSDYLLLWGQNTAAYVGDNGNCYMDDCAQQSWGLDLYGTAKPLPEPGTLMLMLLGLLSLAAVSYQRGQTVSVRS